MNFFNGLRFYSILALAILFLVMAIFSFSNSAAFYGNLVLSFICSAISRVILIEEKIDKLKGKE